MTAREIEGAATELRELRIGTVGDLVLAGVAFALAIAAGRMFPPLALPLLAGGMAMTALGIRAFVRRFYLVEDLALEADAYELRDVRRHAAHTASVEHRRYLARRLRLVLRDEADPQLLELVERLENPAWPVEPCRLVAVGHALQDPGTSAAELRARLRNAVDW